MILFLDDCLHRTRIFIDKYPQGITTTQSKSMIALLKLPMHVQYLFLDHDLNGDVAGYNPTGPAENTGMEVVEWLENNTRQVGQIVVHSCNAGAAPYMVNRLQKAKYYVVGCPFFDLIPQLGR